MKKVIGQVLVVALILTLTPAVFASDFSVAVDFSPFSSLKMDSLLNNGEVRVDDWTGRISAKYTGAEDLLVSLSYTTAIRTANVKTEEENEADFDRFNRRLLEGAFAYKFFEQDAMTIHGGLGYQLIGLDFKGDDFVKEEGEKLSGQGFTGHVNVGIDVMEDLTFNAAISGTPWLKWKYTYDDESRENIDGYSFNYQVGLEYTLPQGFGVHAGYSGGRIQIDEFRFDSATHEESKGSYSGISAGVSMQF